MSWIGLLRSRRVGPATFYRLMAEYGSAAAALAALPEIAAAAGVKDYTACPPGVARAELRDAEAAEARFLAIGMPEYPSLLAEIDDAPPFLWALGDIGLLSRPSVALVGAREASSAGRRMAARLGADLSASGYVVVSGLARGIDTEAHRAALGGGTIAVLPSGVDSPYPLENADLGREIAEGGLCLSERPPGTPPQPRHFVQRNRIIAGLSHGVVVVEAAAKSGSLNAPRTALDLGREVMAVPGHPFDARAGGCNALIRDGATLVRGPDDVREALGPPQRTAPAAARRPAAAPVAAAARPLDAEILDRLADAPLSEDDLIRQIARPVGEVAPEVTALELDGRLARGPGGLLHRLS